MNILQTLDSIQDHVMQLETIKQAAVDFFNTVDERKLNVKHLSDDRIEVTVTESMILHLTNLRNLTFEKQDI